MSPVYRMIHGLDDEKPRAPRMPAQSGSFDDPIFSAIAVTPLQGAALNCGSRISAACTPAPANVECLSPVQSATLPRRMSDCTINNINNTGFIYPSDTSCNHPTSSINSSHDSVSFSPSVEDVPFVPLCRVNSEVIVTERPANGSVLSAAECFRNGIGNKSVDCLSNSTTSPRYGTSFRVLHCLYGSEPEVDDCDDVFHEADDNICTTNNTLAHGHGYPTNSQTLPTRRNKHRYFQNNHKPSAEPREDEKTFTGLNRTEIPSKSFQRLQQYTDQNSIDTTSIRHPNPEDGDAIGDYSQASIRYMGRNIPSKSFRMLQNLTGGPDNTPIPPPQRRARKPVQPPVQESNPDDVVDIAYVGSDIPSKSFRMLQNSVGESAAPSPPPPHANMVGPTPSNTGFGAGQVSGQPSGLVQNNRGRTVKVIQLRQPPKPQAHNDTVTEF